MRSGSALKPVLGLVAIAGAAWVASFVGEWMMPASIAQALRLQGGSVVGSVVALYLLLSLCGCCLALVALFDRAGSLGAWVLRAFAAAAAVGLCVATWAWAAGFFASVARVAGGWAAPGPLAMPLVLATLISVVAGVWLMATTPSTPDVAPASNR